MIDTIRNTTLLNSSKISRYRKEGGEAKVINWSHFQYGASGRKMCKTIFNGITDYDNVSSVHFPCVRQQRGDKNDQTVTEEMSSKKDLTVVD